MAGRKKKGLKYFLVVFVGSLIIATLVGLGSEMFVRHTSLISSWIFLFLVILTGIVFDMIGMAASAATEAPHHAKASNQVFGARQSVFLIRHADVVATFANDIVGDVAGTLSGVMTAKIAIDLLRFYPSLKPQEIMVNTGLLALSASLTITGKAAGKSFGIYEANEIMGLVGKMLAMLEKVTGQNFTGKKKRGGRKNGAARKNS